MTAPFDDSEHARITQTTPDYSSIPWNNDFSKILKNLSYVDRISELLPFKNQHLIFHFTKFIIYFKKVISEQ